MSAGVDEVETVTTIEELRHQLAVWITRERMVMDDPMTGRMELSRAQTRYSAYCRVRRLLGGDLP